MITNDGSSPRDITSRIAKAPSTMCRLSNPLFRKHRISIRTNINMYRAMVVSVLLYGSEAWVTTLADRRRLDVFDMRCQRRFLRVFWRPHVSNQSIRERTKQPTASSLLRQRRLRWLGHLHRMPPSLPPSLYEESLTSTLTSMVGRDQEAAPKPDGRIQSNMISILLASTPSMPPRWSMTDPSGRPLLADCQRSNPSMALKSSKSSWKMPYTQQQKGSNCVPDQMAGSLTSPASEIRQYNARIRDMLFADDAAVATHAQY